MCLDGADHRGHNLRTEGHGKMNGTRVLGNTSVTVGGVWLPRGDKWKKRIRPSIGKAWHRGGRGKGETQTVVKKL